ncbi:hypothetical protein [Cellulomonas sp. P24]|uniref:hypothetical protein n=1 Tax=Cellulomonas sp. P24 TaxID=2885206 RepID=UPI00216B5187|nr:hypothetical protein [Cellulomonas sp. P24]MCR6493283.1 hypothetical protein [Cellulomonas sp. P24]
MRRPLVPAALAGALALLLAACGGGTSTVESTANGATRTQASTSATPTAELTGASFISRTSAALLAAGSYAFTYTATTSGVTVNGSGRFVGTSAADLGMDFSVDTGGSIVRMLVADGHAYMDGALVGATGTWIDLTDATSSGLTDVVTQMKDSIEPSAMFAGLSGDALTVTKGDTTTVDGTEATAYRLTMDLAAMTQVLGREMTSEELDQFKATAGTTSMDVVYYLDANDRPISTTITMGTFMTQELHYSGFGTQEPITAPAPADVVPASQLGL